MSNELQPLVDNLNSYTQVNSKITIMNKKCSELRSERSNLEETIIHQIKNLSLESKKLKIQDKSYYLGENRDKPALTLDLIKQVAKSTLGSDQAERFMSNLVNYRNENKKITQCLKVKKKRAAKSSKKRSLDEGDDKSLTKDKSNYQQSLKKKL